MARFFPKVFQKRGSDGVERNYCKCKCCGETWQVSGNYTNQRSGYVCMNCASGKKIIDGRKIGYPVDAGVVFVI